ncbi:MAG: hypothetical protein DSO07_07485 [Thermoproteota archaeon]|jgi:hypothetical protein|uniref:Uncharacterized protein n=1 Tax=Candidatus Methanodesulfokora washburnensis TaxID=2478471 RepID=A0A3R9PFA4_9CREN|nr:hypothetical protein [Candidatus Methanodesulfokores washburnensis]RSN72848.1 hypothetical protein D6D85_12440 [Candidatus Methanodesulfokores washburnensis]RZN63736.1 MAG: hypothetical protein EF810_00095 [Candidatus Methanodesulfokores washburnensis]TDA40869.1 MAG: hypothetical protein DSO07_07485 [Candidatus Korarchaeota archaeon]
MTTTFTITFERKCFSRITAELERNDQIRISIASTCPSAELLGKRINKIKKKDLLKPIHENPVCITASDMVCTACVIPLVIVNACWVETKLIPRSMFEQHSTITIKFES